MGDIGLLFAVFVVLLVIGMPIAFCLGISSLVYIAFSNTLNFTMLPQKMVISLGNFMFIALPMFLLAGELMNTGGITKRLIRVAEVCVGRFKGGLAQVNVLVSMLFGGINGMASADTVAVGSVIIPAMREQGYDADFSCAITVASSTLGAIIPPSTMFIIYGSTANVSIGAMFMGGIVPGILLGLMQMLYVLYLGKSRKNRDKIPPGTKLDFQTSKKYILAGAPTLLLPVFIIGGVAGGIVTATEVSCIAALYALFLSLATKELKIKDLPRVFANTAKSAGSLMIILSTSSVFAYVLAIEKAPQKLVTALLTLTGSAVVLILLINVFLIIVGTFMDSTPSIMILTPILVPMLMELGMHPIHIGIMICFNLIIGFITPPVGQCLYLASSISGRPIEKISKAAIPFIIISIIMLLSIAFFPQLVLTVPRLVKLI